MLTSALTAGALTAWASATRGANASAAASNSTRIDIEIDLQHIRYALVTTPQMAANTPRPPLPYAVAFNEPLSLLERSIPERLRTVRFSLDLGKVGGGCPPVAAIGAGSKLDRQPFGGF